MNKRFKDIEFEWSDMNKMYQLLQWDEKYKYVIAFFKKDKEGFYMETIGRRYQDALRHDADAVIVVTEYAFDFLNAVNKFEQSVKEL